MIVQVKALACELPVSRGLPLSRMSIADVAREVRSAGIVARISDKTVWRWLHEDAIRPWQQRCWIFPRDPDFASKAGRILDRYEGPWQGTPLGDDEVVIAPDEKTSIQARRRIHAPAPTQPGKATRVEHEYERLGAWAYLAAWDVRRARAVHASWLNQAEIDFAILQRKALTPNDFVSLADLEERLHGFACYYETIAKPSSSGRSPERALQR